MKREILKQIKTFLIILTILTTFVFILIFKDKEKVGALGMLMMWIPGISAIFTSLISKDKIGDYGWKPGKLKQLGWAYILPLIAALIAFGFVWISGLSDFTPEEVKNYRWARYLGFDLPAPFLAGFLGKAVLSTFIAMLLTFGEEVGWTGFLTQKILKLKSVPVTSLIVGVLWSVWHFPAIIGGVYGWEAPLWIALPSFTIAFIGVSFIRTTLWSRSKSLWTGVLLHASHNIIFMSMFWEMTVKNEYTSYLVSETGIVSAIVYLAVGILFWKLLQKKNRKLNSN